MTDRLEYFSVSNSFPFLDTSFNPTSPLQLLLLVVFRKPVMEDTGVP